MSRSRRGGHPANRPRPTRAPAPAPAAPHRPSWLGDLAILAGAFILATLLAEAFGAANLGTALTFGQIAFAAAVVYVITRR